MRNSIKLLPTGVRRAAFKKEVLIKAISCKSLLLSMSGAWIVIATTPALAQEPVTSGEILEEIITTARKRSESLQDVPVTATTLGATTIDRLQLNSVKDMAERVPTFHAVGRASGGGGSLYLRGIGTNSISAAFDSAIALNFDGVVANSSRLVQNSSLDLDQVEVLKGPQSLYFGKGATAGVISIKSRDPSDEFEAGISAAYEAEEKGVSTEAYLSGPVSETLGARFAVKGLDIEEAMENSAPEVANRYRGEASLDARLTLVWNPSDTFSANFKYGVSNYENDGALIFAQTECRGADNTPLGTNYAGGLFPNNFDCDFRDDALHIADQNAVERISMPGNNGGVPFQEQDVSISRLVLVYDLAADLALTSVTGYFDLEEKGFDCFAYDSNGHNCVATFNTEESWSQEVRLQSSYAGRINFMLGAYYQDRDLVFQNNQNVTGTPFIAGVLGEAFPLAAFGFGAVDRMTGYTFDWIKRHPTETEAQSIFGSVTVGLSDNLELTAGVRWSREEKENRIMYPFVHETTFAALAGQGIPIAASGDVFLPPRFSDENISPEISLTYALEEDVNVFAAYKTGFKSGGIDNSVLPFLGGVARLQAGQFDEVVFDSETAEGVEFGIKSTLMAGSLRLNATAYSYIFEDLQIQEFNAVALAFTTGNAGELTNRGVEVDAVWLTPVNRLILRSAVAYTDSRYSKRIVNQGGVDLDGNRRQNSPLWSGNLGLDYTVSVGDSLEAGVGLTAHYSGEYGTADGDTPDNPVQDAFWRGDLVAFIADNEGTWEVSFTARNIADEIYTIDSVGRPNSAVSADGLQDKIHFQNRGRQMFLQASYRY